MISQPLGTGIRSISGPQLRPTLHVITADPAVDSALRSIEGFSDLAARQHRNADEFLAAYDPLGPACLLLDISAQGIDGLGLIRDLTTRGDMLPTWVLGPGLDTDLVVAAIQCGAIGFSSMPIQPHQLGELLTRLLARAQPAAERRRELQQLHGAIQELTGREHEVFLKIAAGRSVKQIASELGLKTRTVHIYQTNCLRKLGVGTVIELVCLMAGAPQALADARHPSA